MPSHASLREWHCCCRAIASSSYDRLTCTYTKMSEFSTQLRQTLLRESTQEPTRCCELTCGWPDFNGIVDASSHGIGGVIFGKILGCTPTIFWWQWPKDICSDIITFENPQGTITNSDLEMAGLLLLWLAMEEVCGSL